MATSEFKDPAYTVEQQIQLLKDKGLIIEDEGEAILLLTNINYFRIKRYSYYFRKYDDQNNWNFHEGTTFNSIVDFYWFDKKLRLIIFSAIETIEISLKSHLSN